MKAPIATGSEHYLHDDMASMMKRSRDLLSVARQLNKENPELHLTSCIGVVLGAIRDIDSESEQAVMEDIANAIDELRKRLT